MATTGKPGEAQPEAVQSKSDPSTVSHLQRAAKRSNELADPSMDEILREAANKEYVSNGVPIKHS